MDARIAQVGADVLCRSTAPSVPELRLDGDQARKSLEAWAKRYDEAVSRRDDVALLTIGREMFAWLDLNGWASGWAKATGPRAIEVQVDDLSEPLQQALLDAPWELLARKDGYLADDTVQLFEVSRRIGPKDTPLAPRYRDLQLMFMAASPEGEVLLDFEAEEAAILQATKSLPLHLVVEESGAAEFLGVRLDLDGPFEVLHLSCHGGIHPQHGHVLALEDEAGQLAYANAGAIVALLGEVERTPLVFLSACQTAEQATAAKDGGRRFEPFVQDLIRAGVANVLGWDGSVYDTDAQAFAEAFYGELAGRQRVTRATAMARQALRRANIGDPQRGRHWHLARLYLGSHGGGALADKTQPKRVLASSTHEEQFLDAVRGEVPVAKRTEFVGRRRQAQAVLKAFREQAAGVLIHGMGNLGKSSLAARIASRMSGHQTVVIFGKYDALTIFDRVVEALPADKRTAARTAWRDTVIADTATLREALETLLKGPLDDQPILLIVDDLERILETPQQSDAPTPMQVGYRATYVALLSAFRKAQTNSQLLLTSRYQFTLPDGHGGDLAAGLTPIPLRPMERADQNKQLRAAARPLIDDLEDLDQALASRALAAAGGNPGLQATLMTPILKGEKAAAKKALEAIEYFQQNGAPPEAIRQLIAAGVAQDPANAMLAFFKRMAFDTYRAALTPEQTIMLQAACVFSTGLPIPRPALEAAGAEAGMADAGAALDRLLGLGLVDDWGSPDDTPAMAVNPLARPLIDALDIESTARLAGASLSALAQVWRHADGNIAHDSRAVELSRLALLAPAPDPALLDDAANAAARYLFNREHDARRAYDEVLRPALDKLQVQEISPTQRLLLIVCDCANRLGEKAAQDRALEMMAQTEVEGPDGGSVLLRLAHRDEERGHVNAALEEFTRAASCFLDAGQQRDWAIARGGVADILEARGQLDEVLRIRTEDELPVYRELGDVRSVAVTQGQIADILQARGQLIEALRIRTEDQLPVFQKLGDVREMAVTQGQIADILQARGQLDDALRIRTEDTLPVYQKLGDVRSVAITQSQIADILQARGQLDEALRIRTEDELPVFRKLGDVRSVAVTQGKIADLLQARGQLDEALRIRTKDQLPVYRKLGDVYAVAVTQGKIAGILQARGQLDDALRIFTEELLPVFRKLGAVREVALTQGKIAGILQARGQLNEALAMHELRLPFARQQSDLDSIAHINFSTAQIRLQLSDHQIDGIQQACDDLEEAFEIALKLQRPDAIDAIGELLAQALAKRGLKSEALTILDHAQSALNSAGNASNPERWQALRQTISNMP
jgi:tetratricopeptide (TPR) repeat protein